MHGDCFSPGLHHDIYRNVEEDHFFVAKPFFEALRRWRFG
jgi:hypothetical protein